MSFTQVALEGTVTLDHETPANGAVVSLLLNTPITDGTQIVAPEPVTTRCASDGTFGLTVNANDDTTTLPLNTYYQVSITYGNQTLSEFNVIVPKADISGVDLFSLAQLPNPNVVNPYVSQLVAGTGIVLSPTGGTGQVIVSSSAGGIVYFSRPGQLGVETENARLPAPSALSIVSAMAMVNTAPTGASLVVDILKNGSTIWPTNPGNRPTITAGNFTSSLVVPDVTSLSAGDYLQVSIVQVGSTVPGSDLTVSVLL